MDIQLACNSVPNEPLATLPARPGARLVTPGQLIYEDTSFMRGHGTYMEHGAQIASVAGPVTQVNRLVTVTPLRQIYQGAVGDTIIGRVKSIGSGRWKLDVNSSLDGELRLVNVQLPGGEQRRTNQEDELCMRDLIPEGSLVCVEVQKIGLDGELRLAARNQKFGKLGQGLLVPVPASLVSQDKQRIRGLPCGAQVTFAANGYVFVAPPREEGGGACSAHEEVLPEVRDTLARVSNIIRALARHSLMLSATSVMAAYDASNAMGLQAKDILKAHVQRDLSERTLQTLAELRG